MSTSILRRKCTKVIEGEPSRLTIDGVSQVARPGLVAIVPGNVPHSVRALTDAALLSLTIH